MKKIVLSLIVIASILTACKGEKKEKLATTDVVKVETKADQLNNVDISSSVLTWKGTKPGGAHDGVVSLKSGNLLVENGGLKSGEFVIDLNTIKNLDMAEKPGAAAKLEGHLKNADFFDIAVFPTSTFIITNVEKKEGKLHVTGNLQIKDVTKSITIPASISTQDGVTTFKSEVFNVNRTDFNVKYKSKSIFANLKDKFIDDLMELSFVVKTKA